MCKRRREEYLINADACPVLGRSQVDDVGACFVDTILSERGRDINFEKRQVRCLSSSESLNS